MDTSRITLNFTLTPGTNYRLTTNETLNNQNLGFNSPRLQRSNQSVNYPYEIPGVLSITGSNQGQNYYYYFYDWEVKEPDVECVSERVPAVADITTGLNENDELNAISLFPNPTSSSITINTGKFDSVNIELTDITGRLLNIYSFSSIQNNNVIIDLSSLAKGVYNIMINTESGSIIKKLVVN